MTFTLKKLAADVAVKNYTMRNLEEQLDWQSFRYLLCRTNEEDFKYWRLKAKIVELEMKLNNGDIMDMDIVERHYHQDVIAIYYTDGSVEEYDDDHFYFAAIEDFMYGPYQDWCNEQVRPMVEEADKTLFPFHNAMHEGQLSAWLNEYHRETDDGPFVMHIQLSILGGETIEVIDTEETEFLFRAAYHLYLENNEMQEHFRDRDAALQR